MKNVTQKYAEISNQIYDICSRKELTRRKCMGLGRMECKMLNFLYNLNGSICMNDLAEEMEVSHSRITRIIDALIKKDLVKRFPSKKDRRSWLAQINENGIKANEKTIQDLLDLQEKLLEKIPKSKQESMYKNLKIFVEAYQEALTEKEKETDDK